MMHAGQDNTKDLAFSSSLSPSFRLKSFFSQDGRDKSMIGHKKHKEHKAFLCGLCALCG